MWFSPSGDRALLLAETKAAGYDLDAQARALAVIKERFTAVRAGAGMTLLLSGPAVIATLSQDAIRAEIQLLSVAASVLVVAILWFAYRSPRPVLLSALPLLSAILTGMAAVGILFGYIHGITLGFGITLLGVAIDYPIHFFSHLDGCLGVKGSLRRIWPTLRLGAITTAMGYLAMITTAYGGLAQLGIFAIVGLLTAAACTRWVLPVLLPPLWAPSLPARDGLTWLLYPNPMVAVIFLVSGILVLLALTVIAPPLWKDDLAALSPIPGDVLALDRQLRTALGAPETSHMIVISAPDAETALQRGERLGKTLESWIHEGRLTGFESAARYLPSRKTQRERRLSLPEPAPLAENLDHALTGLPFKTGLFEPFLQAVEATRTRPLLHLKDLEGTALGLRVSSLLFQTDRGWNAVLPLAGVQDPERLSRDLARRHHGDGYYLNMKQETQRVMAQFRDAALLRLGWGAVLITMALWFGLKNWRRVLAVLVPVTLAIVVDVALLLWLGSGLNLFHLVSLLLVLGIGIDYSLFFSRPDRELSVRKRTLHAVLVCSGSTIGVFGMLALSSLPVLRAIGQTVAIGALLSLLMAVALARRVAIDDEEIQPRNKNR